MKITFGNFLCGVGVGGLLVLAGLPAFAQSAETSTASPARVQEQILKPGFNQREMPVLSVREQGTQSAPAGSEKIKFTLQSISMDGATALPDSQTRATYADLVGQTISLADLYGVAEQITRLYRNSGYILTQVIVPPQTIEGGNARLSVVEGFIDRVSVNMEQGAKSEPASAMKLIRDYAGRIPSGRALNVKDLERYILLINDLPGVEARGVISPSANKTGAADLMIMVRRNPMDGLIAIDNYGTRYLGPVQLSGAVVANSWLGNNESLTGQLVVAPGFEDNANLELGYGMVSYGHTLNASGLKVDLTASYTSTDPGYTLADLGVHGTSRFLGAALSYPAIRTRSTNLYTTLKFDTQDVETRNDFEDTRKDSIRALRGGVRVEHLDALLGAGLNTLDLELSKGLDLFGASEREDANKSRAEGDSGFLKLTAEYQRLQRLAPQWNLLFGVKGQLSNDALLSAEEFGVGGMSYGRGFDPSEIIGDEGLAGKLELQWNMAGELAFTHSNQFYGFFDAGRIWNDDPATNSQKSDTVTSAGLGVRSRIMDYTAMDMALAFPLNRDVETQGDDDPRFYFSLSRKF